MVSHIPDHVHPEFVCNISFFRLNPSFFSLRIRSCLPRREGILGVNFAFVVYVIPVNGTTGMFMRVRFNFTKRAHLNQALGSPSAGTDTRETTLRSAHRGDFVMLASQDFVLLLYINGEVSLSSILHQHKHVKSKTTRRKSLSLYEVSCQSLWLRFL